MQVDESVMGHVFGTGLFAAHSPGFQVDANTAFGLSDRRPSSARTNISPYAVFGRNSLFCQLLPYGLAAPRMTSRPLFAMLNMPDLLEIRLSTQISTKPRGRTRKWTHRNCIPKKSRHGQLEEHQRRSRQSAIPGDVSSDITQLS